MRAQQAGGATTTVSAAARWRCQGAAARPPATTSSLRQVRDVLVARSRQQPRAGMVRGMVRRADASRAYCRAVRGRRVVPGDAGGGADGRRGYRGRGRRGLILALTNFVSL